MCATPPTNKTPTESRLFCLVGCYTIDCCFVDCCTVDLTTLDRFHFGGVNPSMIKVVRHVSMGWGREFYVADCCIVENCTIDLKIL